MYKTPGKANQPSNYLYHVVYISICFMVLFSAYSITQNLISHIYKQLGFANLGRVCVMLIYLLFAVGSIFASYFKRRFSAKLGLVAGSLTYVIFILTGALATYCHKYDLHGAMCSNFTIYFLNFVLSGLIGLGASILWISQAKYVNDCTSESNKGTYHGIFLSLMEGSILIGSLMAAFVLGSADEFTFFVITSILAGIATIMFIFLPSLGTRQIQNQEEQKCLTESIRTFFDCYKNPAHYPVIIACFISGIIISFYATYLPTIVKETILDNNTNLVNQRISFCFLNLGLGQILSGYVVGLALDRFPHVRISDYIFGCTELALVFSFLAIEGQSYLLALIAGFLWGFSDNGAKTLSINLISAKFKGKLELFAQYRATQCLGIVIGSFTTILFSESAGSFFIIMILVAQACCHMVFNLTYNNMNKTQLNVELLEIKTPSTKVTQTDLKIACS